MTADPKLRWTELLPAGTEPWALSQQRQMAQSLHLIGLTEPAVAIEWLISEVQRLQDHAMWRCECAHPRSVHYGDDHPSNWQCGECDCRPGWHLVAMEEARETPQRASDVLPPGWRYPPEWTTGGTS